MIPLKIAQKPTIIKPRQSQLRTKAYETCWSVPIEGLERHRRLLLCKATDGLEVVIGGVARQLKEYAL